MKSSIQYPILCAALLAAGLPTGLFAQAAPTVTNGVMGRLVAERATLVAEVVGINLAKRELTLKGPQGNVETLTADNTVKRLDEVKVGDFVRADYLVSVAAEVRPPTPEEKKHPLVVLDAAGRATPDTAPAGGVARRFKVVTTVEALDRRTQTVTVKGPLGNYVTARVADPARLTKVHIGETIVIVYTEALALSLQKVDKKATE